MSVGLMLPQPLLSEVTQVELCDTTGIRLLRKRGDRLVCERRGYIEDSATISA